MFILLNLISYFLYDSFYSVCMLLTVLFMLPKENSVKVRKEVDIKTLIGKCVLRTSEQAQTNLL